MFTMMMFLSSPKKEPEVAQVEETHLNEVLKRVDALRHNGDLGFCDITLNVKGEHFQAHKIILASCSDYFHAMFNGNMRESNRKLIPIVGMDVEVMHLVLNFIYTGSIPLSVDNVEKVMGAANMMLIKTLKEVCCRFLEGLLSVTNCLGMQKFAEAYTCEELFGKTTNFICENFGYVVEADEFLQLEPEQLSPILTSDDLHVLNEEKVYESLIRWVKHNPKDRNKFFEMLIENVRLPMLAPDYLIDQVESEPLFIEFPKCKELLMEAHHYLLLPNRRDNLQSVRTKARQYENTNLMMVACGGNGETSLNSTVYSFDVQKSVWNELPRLVPERGYHGLAIVGEDMFIVGGVTNGRTEGRENNVEMLDTVRKFDVEQNTWHNVASLHTRRSKMSVTACCDTIFAMGGFDGTTTLNSVESYNPTTNRWKFAAPMITMRRCTCAVSTGQHVYIIGGHDGAQILNTIERYDVETDTWSGADIATMTDRRSFPCAVCVNDDIFVMGGYDGHDTLRTCEVYNITHNEWSAIEAMSTARSNAGAAHMNRKIYVVGGWDGVSLNSVEYYDLVIQEWVRVTSLPRPTTGVRCGIIVHPTSSEQKPGRHKSGRGTGCCIA